MGQELDLIQSTLESFWKMKDLGTVKYFLGVRIVRDRANRLVDLAHDAYAEKVFKRFGYTTVL